MNYLLQQSFQQAEGRYLADTELKPLEDFLQSYTVRLSAYSLLQTQADSLVVQTLRQMAQTDRATIQEHGELCKRDMSYVLRTAALAMLRDDEDGYRQNFILWMQNIMRSLHKEHLSAKAYRTLQSVIQEALPPHEANLINHYLEIFIQALTSSM